MLHIYYGDGKGKTTAAFGLAVRALCAGQSVYIGQFVKSMRYNETKIEGIFDRMRIEQLGRGCFIGHDPEPADVGMAREGLARCRALLVSGEYDLVLLDIMLPQLSGMEVLRRLRKESDALAAMLLACWAMMNLHGLMELNFSIRAYQCAAFFLLAAVIALYGTPLLKKEPGRFVRYTAAGLSVVYLVTYGVLVWNNWAVNREREEFTTTSAVAYLSALESFAQRNVLDPEDLQLRYVAQAVTMELDEGQQATMLSYVDTLRGSGTYIACTGLAQMYYLPAGELEEVFASSLEGIGQVASNADAWNEQMDFYRTKVLPAAGTEGAVQVAAGVRQLGQAMDAYNEGRVQPVELSEQNQVFLNSANTAWEKNFSDEATFQLLLTSSGLSVSTGE